MTSRRPMMFVASLLMLAFAGCMEKPSAEIADPQTVGAAGEFARYYREMTGSDMPRGLLRLGIDPAVSKTGLDAYAIRSEDAGVAIVGSNVRSVYYGVYDLLERRGGCHWFWDGDVVPKRAKLDLSGLDVHEESGFEYRGLRYFAHRGLTRFQAEHWGFDDWKREIDWMLKRRLNVFMLRIGQDDLFQRAFPEFCAYPDPSKPLPGHGTGFDNRSPFWSLQFRGQLRIDVQRYGRERGLMMPEDIGSMTHWYSRTPEDFLDKANPDFLPQVTASYGERNGLVWDIRQQKWLDAYWKLSSTSVEQFSGGRAELLHLFGLGERRVSTNAAENYQIKLNGQKEFMRRARTNYPDAKIMHPGWDYYYTWQPAEVNAALKHYDPEHEILWDYEGDAVRDYQPELTGVKNNFTKWGVIGHFPYTYSTFLAYCEALDMRANYPLIEERQKLIENDAFCKGYVFWPEASHTDTLFLRYFTANAWSKRVQGIDRVLDEFCASRYGERAESLKPIWKQALAPSALFTWDGNYEKYAVRRAKYRPEPEEPKEESAYWAYKVRQWKPAVAAFVPMMKALREIDWTGDFIRRDTIDLARMIGDRMTVAQNAIMMDAFCRWRKGEEPAENVIAAAERYVALGTAMAHLLALHTDFSIWESYLRLKEVAPVPNPDFPQILLDNATCEYCSSHQYEAAEYWYRPVMRDTADRIIAAVKAGDRTAIAPPNSTFVKTSKRFRAQQLETMKPTLARTPASYRSVIGEFLAAVRKTAGSDSAAATVLVEDGRTDYVISIDQKATATDRFAARELAEYLGKATGAKFAIETDSRAAKTIELGTARAWAAAKKAHPLAFEPEESVYGVTEDGRLFICGEGPTGNAYGVYSFLERELGCLWLTVMGDELVPKRRCLALGGKVRVDKPWLEYRTFLGRTMGAFFDNSSEHLFWFRNRVNLIELNYGNLVRPDLKGALVPRLRMHQPSCHSFPTYIPPAKYFDAHPDWFTMDEQGKRVGDRQLCFMNAGLRAEMTKNLLAHIGKCGGSGFFDLSASDQNGPLCFCPRCREMSEKHRSPGAPLYDYLYELGVAVKAKYPEAIVHTLAYRKDTTQHPPVGMKPFPENVHVVFAPLDDDFSKDMAHENNIATWVDFRDWAALAKMWLWSYPTVYTTPQPPYGGLARAHRDVQIVFRDGLLGATIEHDVGCDAGQGFFDLQSWMLLKCMQDPESDWHRLRDTWCRAMFGVAAQDVIAYEDYLEGGLANEKDFMACPGLADAFITVQDLVTWERRFDEMEAKVKGDDAIVQRLRETRIPLDMLALVRWQEVVAARAQTQLGGVETVYGRVKAAYRAGVLRRHTRKGSPSIDKLVKNLLGDGSFQKVLESRYRIAKNGLKPLPEKLASLDRAKVYEVVPLTPEWGETFIEDPDAASGFARVRTDGGAKPSEISVPIGVYDRTKRAYAFKTALDGKDLVLDKYHLYYLGSFRFPSGSCYVALFENPRFRVLPFGAFRPGADNEMDIYVSLKFSGPLYGGTSDDGKSRVSMDRVVFVRK